MKHSILTVFVALFILMSCKSNKNNENADWCNQEIRIEFVELNEVEIKSNWFKVYEVGENVFAISEPYNFQEVISYLIIGNNKAVLFDTGMGLESMSSLVKQLTKLPITVINSHSHYDHIGSNSEFDYIVSLNSEYTKQWANSGWSHNLVKQEISSEALCLEMLTETINVNNYYVKPFNISEYITDGQIIDLGERELEVVSVPGHTPDALALLDRKAGYLWTGDTFYEAAIWLFFEGTNLDNYETSINRLAKLAPTLNKVYPAHNTPISEPDRLTEAADAFHQIISGQKKPDPGNYNGHPDDNIAVEYHFEHFSFLIRKDHLKLRGILD